MSTALPGYFKLNGLLKINGDVPLVVVNGDVVLLFFPDFGGDTIPACCRG